MPLSARTQTLSRLSFRTPSQNSCCAELFDCIYALAGDLLSAWVEKLFKLLITVPHNVPDHFTFAIACALCGTGTTPNDLSAELHTLKPHSPPPLPSSMLPVARRRTAGSREQRVQTGGDGLDVNNEA